MITLVVGVWLRSTFGGLLTLGPLALRDVRHAHSHLGYFAVLFPLAWLALKRAGARVPEGNLVVAYLIASGVAFLGFLRTGYGPEAIAGSTVVGLAWLYAAWLDKGAARKMRAWRGGMPLAVLAASCLVPPIALFTRREPGLAQSLVEAFLFILLLGVITPAALASRRARAVPWPLWTASVIAGGLALGPLAEVKLLLLGLVFCGAALVYVFVDDKLEVPLVERALWLGLAAGLFGLGSTVVPDVHDVAMAGIHFAILGPVLVTLLAPQPRWWTTAWGALAALMSLCVLAPRVLPTMAVWSQRAAALDGVLLVLLALHALFASRR